MNVSNVMKVIILTDLMKVVEYQLIDLNIVSIVINLEGIVKLVKMDII